MIKKIIKIYFEWIVFKNDSSFYNALADGLNRQLELTKSTTDNNYTEEIEGKKIFTKEKLDELAKDKKKTQRIIPLRH